MNKPVASIIWPILAEDAVRLLLLYMLKVTERLGISFDSVVYDPVSTVKGILAGELLEDHRRAALLHWWAVIDGTGIRNFESRDVLIARLAVCFLTPNEADTSDLGEYLSWFLEVLGLLGEDVDNAIDIMAEHFSFA
jgi:hypothetical protein